MSNRAVAETSSNEQDVRSMARYFTRLNSSSKASHDPCDSVSFRRFRTSVRADVELSRLTSDSRCSMIDAIGLVLCFSHDRR